VQKGVCDTFLFKWDSKIVEEILPEIFSYYGKFYFIQKQKNKIITHCSVKYQQLKDSVAQNYGVQECDATEA